MATRYFSINSQEELADIFGPFDENIRNISKTFNVSVRLRRNRIEIRGGPKGVDGALSAIASLRDAAEKNGKNVKWKEFAPDGTDEYIFKTHSGRKIVARTPAQKKYVLSMERNPVTIATGPAGTGKTFLAVVVALRNLFQGKFSKIILSRPIVEAGERLGFLPGDFEEKVFPYLAPLYDAFLFLIGSSAFNRYRKNGIIEIVPLAYMRGRTLDNAFVILDEAQNTTILQMKMLLTRLGPNGVVVVNGDTTQIDLGDEVVSGLVHAGKILKKIRGINFLRFTEKDVVRHPLVKKIVAAYEESSK